MGLVAYLVNRVRRSAASMQHDDYNTKGNGYSPSSEETSDDAARLEEKLREEVRRYEDDLRELAKT
ncbi:MAG: hypothetical protein M3141_01770 [Actinomycetota bacterium]|nr:hypothetical protein [Actinomycetota bacterium]